MDETEGRIIINVTVPELIHLIGGIVSMVIGTRLNAEDQAKMDAIKAALDANDPAAAAALANNNP